MTTDNNITAIDNGQGQCLSIVGDSYRILISGEQTGGSYAVIDMLVPPGGGPGPHAHKHFQEMFYVVEGEIEFKMEGGKYTAEQGSFVNIPLGGAVHCFKNTTDKLAHLLCTVVPAGLDNFFQEIGKPIESGTFLPHPTLTIEELGKLKAIAEKHGQVLYPPDFLDWGQNIAETFYATATRSITLIRSDKTIEEIKKLLWAANLKDLLQNKTAANKVQCCTTSLKIFCWIGNDFSKRLISASSDNNTLT